MMLDTMKLIKNAEANILISKIDAQTKAQEMIAEAEINGQATVEAAIERAEQEVITLLKEADGQAAEKADDLMKNVAQVQSEIHRQAEMRMDDTARMIVERIVNG